jgi:ubiquinone/menaquinone biosynthesis C-methylase UbiE
MPDTRGSERAPAPVRHDGAVKHADHLDLIRAGVDGAGSRWLELGAGDGEFTLALADLLRAGHITAVDRDRWAIPELEQRVRDRFPATTLQAIEADFTEALPQGPFDGVLAANSLHFVADPAPLIDALRGVLAPGARLVVVEYDADRGNPWVPHPISFDHWTALATTAGFTAPRLIGRVPSRFLGSIYGAVATRA